MLCTLPEGSAVLIKPSKSRSHGPYVIGGDGIHSRNTWADAYGIKRQRVQWPDRRTPGSMWRSGKAPLSRGSWTVFPGKTVQAQGRVGAKALRDITVRGRTRRLLWPQGNEWGREQEVNQSSGSRPVHVGPLNQCSKLGWFGPQSRGHLTISADIFGCRSCGVLLVSHWTPGSKDVFSIHSVQSDTSRKYPNPVSMVPR